MMIFGVNIEVVTANLDNSSATYNWTFERNNSQTTFQDITVSEGLTRSKCCISDCHSYPCAFVCAYARMRARVRLFFSLHIDSMKVHVLTVEKLTLAYASAHIFYIDISKS